MTAKDLKPFTAAMSKTSVEEMSQHVNAIQKWLLQNGLIGNAISDSIDILHTAFEDEDDACRERTYIELHRCGDFYEAKNDSAKVLAAVTGITLSMQRNVPFAGFPSHALDIYLPQLIKAGYMVNVCD